MSKTGDYFKAIEGQDFAALVNLASDFKTFVRILGAQGAVAGLAEEMRDPGVRTAVSERALALAQDRGEEGYEHPWDSALAAYLWLLLGADQGLADVAAAAVSKCPGAWWAGKMAERVLSPGTFHSTAGGATS